MRELKAGREVTSPANSELANSGLLWPASSLSRVTWWLVVNSKSELRPQDKHAQLFPLGHTACYKTPERGQAQGPSLLHCWATEHTGRSYFLFIFNLAQLV